MKIIPLHSSKQNHCSSEVLHINKGPTVQLLLLREVAKREELNCNEPSTLPPNLLSLNVKINSIKFILEAQ